MRVALLILAGLSLSGSAFSQSPHVGALTTFSDHIVPLVIIGEGWSQRLVLSNVDSSTPVVGTLQFYTQEGQPWNVDLKTGSGSTFLVNLQPGATAIFETVAKSTPQVLGWARIDQTIQGLGDLFGQMTFRKQSDGRPDLMTSMLLGYGSYDQFSAYFDNTNGNYTGMGIITSTVCAYSFCQSAEPYTVTILDLNGNVISQKAITQKEGRLYWMNLGIDFPETNGKAGVFQVKRGTGAGSTLTGFSLQFAANGAFTAITPYEN